MELLNTGSTVQIVQTDAFGDFKFDALEPSSGLYRVRVQHPTAGYFERDTTLGETQFLGDIELLGAKTFA